MRNWGIVVTAFYAIVVLLLLSLGMVLLAEDWWAFDSWQQSDIETLIWFSMIPTAFLVGGQALLLFLNVDTSWRCLKPQRHARITAGLVGIMVTILTAAIMLAIATALWGDKFDIPILDEIERDDVALLVFLATIAVIWGIWGVVFYRFSKGSSNVADSAVSWLIKGSVLELLVAVTSPEIAPVGAKDRLRI